MNWYRTAKIGEEYLRKNKVPETNIVPFAQYLNSLPDGVNNYLVKKYISVNPNISLEDLQNIPISIEKEIIIDPKMVQAINQITSIKSERRWLRQMISTNKIKDEDLIKIKLMLDELHALPKDKQKPIETFKDDTVLYDYLNKFRINSEKQNLLPTEGWTLLEDYISEQDLSIKLYNITNQTALDAIAGSHDAAWCVLSKNGAAHYSPFNFYCFVINGKPEVLIHMNSSQSQIKGADDHTLTYGPFIKAISPMLKKYNLIEHNSHDFQYLSEQQSKIEKIENNSDNHEFIANEIREDISNFEVLPLDKWGNYIDVLADYSNRIIIEKISKKALAYLSTYLKVNNETTKLKNLEDKVIDWFSQSESNLTSGRYNNVIPKELHTNSTNGIFNDLRNKAMLKWKNLLTKQPNRWDSCPFKEVKNDPKVLKLVREYWFYIITTLVKPWKYCPFEDIKYNPKLWENLLSKNTELVWKECPDQLKTPKMWEKYILMDPNVSKLNKCPFEEVKNNPKILNAISSSQQQIK
jgi:hypothetical protein